MSINKSLTSFYSLQLTSFIIHFSKTQHPAISHAILLIYTFSSWLSHYISCNSFSSFSLLLHEASILFSSLIFRFFNRRISYIVRWFDLIGWIVYCCGLCSMGLIILVVNIVGRFLFNCCSSRILIQTYLLSLNIIVISSCFVTCCCFCYYFCY